jgi:DNA-binding response OmpR family regulator
MPGAKILLIEGDPVMSLMLTRSLEESGYCVTQCTDCTVGWNKFMKERFDLCIVDAFMSGQKCGVDVLKIIRAKNTAVPIIMTSARPTEDELFACLKNGADAYLSKPYNILELLKRISVFLRRSNFMQAETQDTFALGDLVFDYNSRQLKRNNYVIHDLTERESELLQYFCANHDKLLRKEDILLQLWGKYDEMLERSLTVFVGRLRKYIKSQQTFVIETVPWIGFRFSTLANASKHNLLAT